MEAIPGYDNWKTRAPEGDETGVCSFCGGRFDVDDLEYNTREGLAACQACVMKGLMEEELDE